MDNIDPEWLNFKVDSLKKDLEYYKRRVRDVTQELEIYLKESDRANGRSRNGG